LVAYLQFSGKFSAAEQLEIGEPFEINVSLHFVQEYLVVPLANWQLIGSIFALKQFFIVELFGRKPSRQLEHMLFVKFEHPYILYMQFAR